MSLKADKTPPAQPRSWGAPSFLGCLVLIVALLGSAIGTGLIFLSRSSPLETPSPVVIVGDTGTVDLKPRDSRYLKSATTGAIMQAGDTLYTGTASSAAINLPDGSKAQLAPNSKLEVWEAWINGNGVITTAVLSQQEGGSLYSIASAPGTDFLVETNAVSFEASASLFEVAVQPEGVVEVKVFDGVVHTRPGTTAPFAGSEPVQAGQEQVYDSGTGRTISIDPLQVDLRDPLGQLEQVEEGAVAVQPTPGTEQTFISLVPLQAGQTNTAADYATGGGNITALLSSSASEIGLTIIDPGGRIYVARGAPPLQVRIPDAPPGSYHAQVTGIHVNSPGDTFAMAFVVADACYPAAGNGYERRLQSWQSLVRSIKMPDVGDASLTTRAPRGEAITDSNISLRGASGTVTVLIVASPPRAEALVLSFQLDGVPIPNRAVAVLNISQVTTLDLGLRVDRIFGCGQGLMIEGQSL